MTTNPTAAPDPAKRGFCPACRFSHRLLADGTMARHYVWVGADKIGCEGSYRLPAPRRPTDRRVAP